MGNWCIHHSCSVCDYFKLFSFLFFSFLFFSFHFVSFIFFSFFHLLHIYIQWADTALAHVSHNPTSVYTAMFCFYLFQTNKQTNKYLDSFQSWSTAVTFCQQLSTPRMNNQWIASCSVVTVYRNIRLGRMLYGGKNLRINCWTKFWFFRHWKVTCSDKMNFSFKLFVLSLSL